jgi:hypothetical protein
VACDRVKPTRTENVNVEMNILKTGKKKNFTLEQAIRVHRRSRGIALLLR